MLSQPRSSPSTTILRDSYRMGSILYWPEASIVQEPILKLYMYGGMSFISTPLCKLYRTVYEYALSYKWSMSDVRISMVAERYIPTSHSHPGLRNRNSLHLGVESQTL